MQNAIIYAWRISSIEDLSEHYTAKINHETGIPTPTGFIYYYVEKNKKDIIKNHKINKNHKIKQNYTTKYHLYKGV